MKEHTEKNEQHKDQYPAPSPPGATSGKQNEELSDPDAEISETDMRDLEQAANDRSSDESRSADLLDDEDNEGDALNEGPDNEDLFDTGEDLDISEETLFPDEDPDSADN